MRAFNRYGVSGVSGLAICQAVPFNEIDTSNRAGNSYYQFCPTADGENFQIGGFTFYSVNGDLTNFQNNYIFTTQNNSSPPNWTGSNSVSRFGSNPGGQNSIGNGNVDFPSVISNVRINSNGVVQFAQSSLQNIPLDNNQYNNPYLGMYFESGPNYNNSFTFPMADTGVNKEIVGSPSFASITLRSDGVDFCYAQNNNTLPIPPPYYYQYNFNAVNGNGPVIWNTTYLYNAGWAVSIFNGFPPYQGGGGILGYQSASDSEIFNVPSSSPSLVQSLNQWIPDSVSDFQNGPYSMPYVQGTNCFLLKIFTGDEFGTPYGLWYDCIAGQYVPQSMAGDLDGISSALNGFYQQVKTVSKIAVPGPSYGMSGNLVRVIPTRTNTGYILGYGISNALAGLDGNLPYCAGVQGDGITFNFYNGLGPSVFNYKPPAPFNEPFIGIYTNKTGAKFTPRLIGYPQGYSGNPTINLAKYNTYPVSLWCSPSTGSIYGLYLPNDGSNNVLITTLGLLYIEPAVTFNFNWRD